MALLLIAEFSFSSEKPCDFYLLEAVDSVVMIILKERNLNSLSLLILVVGFAPIDVAIAQINYFKFKSAARSSTFFDVR